MKSRRLWIGLCALLLILCSAVAVPVIWDRLHTLYPTPDTKSSFLKNYHPQRVIEPFKSNLPSSDNGVNKSGAGRAFVTHTAEFQSFFAMPSEKWMPLMRALSEDLRAQLLQNGAQILSESGEPRSGFHFDYKLGKSFGSVKILPLEIDTRIHRQVPPSEGTVDVATRIEVDEKWFAQERGTIRVQVSSTTHSQPLR
jgi:hypothetical protein